MPEKDSHVVSEVHGLDKMVLIVKLFFYFIKSISTEIFCEKLGLRQNLSVEIIRKKTYLCCNDQLIFSFCEFNENLRFKDTLILGQ